MKIKSSGNVILRLGVFAASLLQLLSPIFTSFNSESESSSPQIIPAGYTFGVWGIITLLAFGYGIYQLIPNRKNAELHIILASRLMAVYLLFTIWLLAAERNLLVVTVIVFLAMFWLLTRLFERILKSSAELLSVEKVLLTGQIGIYGGWTTVAIFANIASAIKYYGVSDTGNFGIIWQSVILVCALSNSIFWIRKFEGNLIYAGTILWAFIGVFFGLRMYSGTEFLQIFTCLAICGVIAATLIPTAERKPEITF